MIHQINSLRKPVEPDSYTPISTVDYNWDISDGDFIGDSIEKKQSDFLTVRERTKRIFILAATVLSGIVVLLVSRILTSV